MTHFLLVICIILGIILGYLVGSYHTSKEICPYVNTKDFMPDSCMKGTNYDIKV